MDGVIEPPVTAPARPVDLPVARRHLDRRGGVIGGEVVAIREAGTSRAQPITVAAMTGPVPKISVSAVPDARTAVASFFLVLRIWASMRRKSSRNSAACFACRHLDRPRSVTAGGLRSTPAARSPRAGRRPRQHLRTVSGSPGSATGQKAERFGMRPAVVLSLDLADLVGSAPDGAVGGFCHRASPDDVARVGIAARLHGSGRTRPRISRRVLFPHAVPSGAVPHPTFRRSAFHLAFPWLQHRRSPLTDPMTLSALSSRGGRGFGRNAHATRSGNG